MTRIRILAAVVAIAALGAAGTTAAEDEAKSWPRLLEAETATVTMYQPQLDSWADDEFESRAAISVQEDGGPLVFGAVWISGHFDVDTDTRLVTFRDITIPTVVFPEISAEDEQRLTAFLEREIPKWGLEVELDRLIPLLENAGVALRVENGLKHDPPRIIIKYEPAVLILIDGDPNFEEIENSSLEQVINSPYLIFRHETNLYLASDTSWFTAKFIDGPWKPTRNLPKDLREVDKQLEERRENEAEPEGVEPVDDRVPEIVVSTVPAELIFIDGKPEFEPLSASNIMVVSNTDSDVVLDIASQNYYVLLSGRWYRTKDLDAGPWEWVANDQLPQQFSEIPADSDIGYLRASVAGTEEAREALLEQAVPQTAVVKTAAGASFNVTYDGDPVFEPIEGTMMEYAINTPAAVILSGGRYYACEQGIWYVASRPTGPWQVCKKVPDEIYTIPPSNPHYNVTYVKVYESNADEVNVGYTPGYTNSYVSHSCVVYGTGWWYQPYWWPRYYYPYHSTWGFHVRWNPWYGWGFGLSYSTGPFTFSIGFGGWGRYGYGGWWGPAHYRPYPRYGYGAAYRAGYRHGYRHGVAAGSRPRPTPYAGTRPSNNIYSRPGNADRVASTRDRTATRQQPSVARDRANNVYTDKSGNVYRRNDNGSWDRRDSGGWSKTEAPMAADRSRPSTGNRTRPSTGVTQPSARPSTGTRPSTGATRPSTRPSTGYSPPTSSLNRDYSARQRGATRSSQYGSSRSMSGAARRGGGGRRR
jgi:hypothetical protein